MPMRRIFFEEMRHAHQIWQTVMAVWGLACRFAVDRPEMGGYREYIPVVVAPA
jgi:hypothetical protein